MATTASIPVEDQGQAHASPSSAEEATDDVAAQRGASPVNDLDVANGLVLLAAAIVRLLPRDISLSASGALMALQRLGPRRLTDLAAGEGLTQPGMTDLVTRLERDGLAQRRRDPDDKRVVWVSLTPAGEDFVRCRFEGATQQLAAVVGRLSADEAAAITAALPAMSRLRQMGISCSGATPC